jgi:hypothetical protein
MTDSVNFDLHKITANLIITESLAKLMGKGSALGKTLYDGNDTLIHGTVVGVVNDYVYGDMYGKPDPVIFACAAPRFANTMYLRNKAQVGPELALTRIEAVLKKDNPAYPFQYKFVDDQFNEMF